MFPPFFYCDSSRVEKKKYTLDVEEFDKNLSVKVLERKFSFLFFFITLRRFSLRVSKFISLIRGSIYSSIFQEDIFVIFDGRIYNSKEIPIFKYSSNVHKIVLKNCFSIFN